VVMEEEEGVGVRVRCLRRGCLFFFSVSKCIS
jgi:hypothetical protein